MTTSTTSELAAKRERLKALLTQPVPDRPHPFEEFVNPKIGQMLRGMGIDVEFVEGKGTVLKDADGREYLDFAGAYGALPFGHNPDRVWEALDTVRGRAEPSLIQPSMLSAAGALGHRLVDISPENITRAWFCNSGAEAVEAALKLVRGHHPERTWIVSTDNGFHGKTLGALSVTGRTRYQEPFGAPIPGYARVPYGNLDAASEFFAQHTGDVAAFVVETVQGEGGVNPAPDGYLAGLREICDEHEALLVVDEVQTGLGRTGHLFSVESHGVRADIITIAKALGGGVVPIGAVLFSDDVASDAFDLRHTSTFGANSVSCRVGLASLDILTANDCALLEHVRDRARQLGDGLARIQERNPLVCAAVRGSGLLWGVELTDDARKFDAQGLLRTLADSEALAGAACGYLLREHGIRVAPAFFSGRVVRVEPPLTVSAAEIDKFLDALEDCLDVMTRGDSQRLFQHLIPQAGPVTEALPDPGSTVCAEPARDDEVRWAFLAHPTDAISYAAFDRGLRASGGDVKNLFDRLNMCRNVESPAGMLLGASRVVTDDNTSTYGEVFALGHDAAELMNMPRRRAVALVRDAAIEAVERGAQVVGLGAYTSIVTDNGNLLGDVGALITTGNAFTASSAVAALVQLGAEDRDIGVTRCAVVGAAGNIGRATTLLLAEQVGALVLSGNPKHPERSQQKLHDLAIDVIRHLRSYRGSAPAGRLAGAIQDSAERDDGALLASLVESGNIEFAATTTQALQQAPLVVVATSSPGSVVEAEDPLFGAIICDVSQPPNVSHSVSEARPDLKVVAGGLVRLPGDRDLNIDFGLPAGVTYACTAETLVAAAQFDNPVLSKGDRLDLDAVRLIGHQAQALGFRLHVRQGSEADA